ncbi:TrmB family transcriptional regulator [Pseudogracilibacillus auburnensis]|uniref:Sugar-specific transcriptional regulator TrmB n=1 Tax=Pseudogracilibacillus auburnensis TaxID=1494959 RepID=A0A2V3W871_9BACI|nr:TrmB family transcriptional regulator [Pseudogracilibacillus auburnensis]MBO1001702.1 TrmB family transcriptional regulator [Pseudogracilibacillus auburnensis]PXW89374.1 sugar-specific transcriptional regulator TrmB [Pseudogracilibacillus auburnensis]
MEIIDVLKRYNFSEYEAKIYLALLKQSPMNGNNIAVQSGVPSAKVYQTLPKLIDRDVVFLMNNGTPSGQKFYSPLPWKELLKNLKDSHKDNMGKMENYFKNIQPRIEEDWSRLYHMEGYEANVDLLKQLINKAEQSILFSCWSKEFLLLKDEFESAFNKGVDIKSILFDPKGIQEFLWEGFGHHQGRFTNERHLGELVAVFDQETVFVLNMESPPHGIISSHAALVKVAENYIRHDIYINQVINDFGDVMKEKYGDEFEDLLHKF